MPTVLTVDDTTEIRTAVGRMLRGAGVDVLEAATGADALELLDGTRVDLILLDVMMPVMDGPAMLRELRARGDHTPVIMVTSESSRKLVAGALQLGITDFILKPFRPDGLRAKVAKALGRELPAPGQRVTAAPPAAAPAPASGGPIAVGAAGSAPGLALPPRSTIDVLIVDDMEQVHRRLRQALPEHVTMHGATDAAEAAQRCREHAYRLILVDLVMPDVDSLVLARQLRALQPTASFLAVALRTAADTRAELLAAGFADLLHKPFDADTITGLVHRVFDARELAAVDGELITANGCEPRDDRVEEHLARLRPALKRALESVAAAGHPRVVIDLRQVPVRGERTVHAVIDLAQDAARHRLHLRLVASPEAAALLARVAETADLDVFDGVERARAA